MEKWFSEGIVRLDGDIPCPSDMIGHTTFEAFSNQQDKGWDQALQGRISVKSGKANALYLLSQDFYTPTRI
jgi:hypothetical protein